MLSFRWNYFRDDGLKGAIITCNILSMKSMMTYKNMYIDFSCSCSLLACLI